MRTDVQERLGRCGPGSVVHDRDAVRAMAKAVLASMSGEMKPATPQRYVPALRFRWLTRLYDPVVAVTTREAIFRQHLIEQADLRAGQRVLDLGCGSGTMAALIKQQHPQVSVIGLDGDPAILALARTKARGAGLDIRFRAAILPMLPSFTRRRRCPSRPDHNTSAPAWTRCCAHWSPHASCRSAGAEQYVTYRHLYISTMVV